MKRLCLISLTILLSVAMAVPSMAAKGTLRVATTTMPNAIDLPMGAERNAHNVSWQIYNSLVWIDDTTKVVPALAEKWTVSEDSTVYTFKLRKNVKFHNGELFNADSVVYSWNRGKQDKMQWKEKWANAKSVEKVDDLTVKITTEGPRPLLLRIIAEFWAMIPPKYHKKVGENGFLNHPVGTGPFKFKEWKKGDRIIFEANPDYWEKGYPKVKTLVFRPIPESTTRVAAIRTGEVDIVTRLSSEEAKSLKGRPNVKVIDYTVDRVYYITFNNLTSGKGKPTESPLVRQAMNYAVDVDAIIDALFDGFGRPSTGYVTLGNWGYDKKIKPFGYDPEKAKKLLAKAGFAKGFKMGFACPAGAYINFEQVCEAIQGYLDAVGIETDLKLMESGKYWDFEGKKQLPPLFGDSWSELLGEALGRLKGALGGKNASFSAWSDPEIDKFLDKISKTVDDEARAKLYVELQRYMQKNPPFIYLYEPVTFEAIGPKVKNYKPRPAENYYLKYTSVEGKR
ncbi:MAG: ABC transporter substrate-binding protein [Desulfobacteraceae bacterium]|nr:ABC transporter substrate-binding protein [Desulfobacteraceae bacterium]